MMAEQETSRPISRGERYRRRLFHNLRALGIVRIEADELDQLESAVGGALHQVHPSTSFRSHLRDNLTLAAQQRVSGLAIEHPRLARQGIILGLSAGLLAATITALVFILRGYWAHAER
ncbi:MAG: hypothetical protein JXA74_15130 [Anaerolineae bacterium]|nr:hypothetical protein [Anaerolineae bacterium]